MADHEVEQTVAVWVRSRWDVQPWLEHRMGHTPDANLAFFRGTVMRTTEVWVAARGDTLVALLALVPGRVEHLYVDPPAQGRGVGSALLDHAKRLMPDGLSLFTHQRNQRAGAFYEGRGFRAVAFGVSPAPESEPDVEYRWDGSRPSP
jgi:ribosomal protein S18 acetylase RimI-like enzyme